VESTIAEDRELFRARRTNELKALAALIGPDPLSVPGGTTLPPLKYGYVYLVTIVPGIARYAGALDENGPLSRCVDADALQRALEQDPYASMESEPESTTLEKPALRFYRVPEERTWAQLLNTAPSTLPSGNPRGEYAHYGLTLPPLKVGAVFSVTVVKDWSHGFGINGNVPVHPFVDVDELDRRCAASFQAWYPSGVTAPADET
jgi:hypothetical protein